MSTKKTAWWLLLLLGEAVLIAAFILFRGEAPANILTLDMVVSSIIYGLIFLSYQTPWIDLRDKSQRQIGALGISWFSVWLYAGFALAAMLASSFVFGFSFSTQLIIHAVLLFFLLLGIWFSSHSADKVQEVYRQEAQNRSRLTEMKNEMRSLQDLMSSAGGLPKYFAKRIDELAENVRFISPSGSSEAQDLEQSFVEVVGEIKLAASDFSANEERVESMLKKAERICQNRKNMYSN